MIFKRNGDVNNLSKKPSKKLDWHFPRTGYLVLTRFSLGYHVWYIKAKCLCHSLILLEHSLSLVFSISLHIDTVPSDDRQTARSDNKKKWNFCVSVVAVSAFKSPRSRPGVFRRVTVDFLSSMSFFPFLTHTHIMWYRYVTLCVRRDQNLWQNGSRWNKNHAEKKERTNEKKIHGIVSLGGWLLMKGRKKKKTF